MCTFGAYYSDSIFMQYSWMSNRMSTGINYVSNYRYACQPRYIMHKFSGSVAWVINIWIWPSTLRLSPCSIPFRRWRNFKRTFVATTCLSCSTPSATTWFGLFLLTGKCSCLAIAVGLRAHRCSGSCRSTYKASVKRRAVNVFAPLPLPSTVHNWTEEHAL